MHKNTSQKKLLIISCSQKKKQTRASAWDLYDGVTYRMLKKIERESNLLSNFDILILSSRYGLVTKDQYLETYDEALTPARSVELKPDVQRELTDFLEKNQPPEVFCCLGQMYWKLIEDTLASSGIPFSNAIGRIGEKLAETRRWLCT